VAMAKALVPGVAHKRGNPDRDTSAQFGPVLATEFEEEVHRLGLTKQTCAASIQLRNWCERNRNRCYIPEWLLGARGESKWTHPLAAKRACTESNRCGGTVTASIA